MTECETTKTARGRKGTGTVRSFCFTWNNYPEDYKERLEEKLVPLAKYMVVGREVGESGTPHLQGYAQLWKQKSLGVLGKLFPWHIEATRGTPEQAANYCKKDGDYYEVGELATASSGGDAEKQRWKWIIEKAKEGDLAAIEEQEPAAFVQRYRTLQHIKKDYAKPPEDREGTTGIWIYGPSGVGKSRTVRECARARGLAFYAKNCNKWWDNYQGEPVVVIDDVDKSHSVLGHHLKIWADRYAFQAEVKGSAMWIRPTDVVVTSQYSIDDIWADVETREALHRRFEVHHMVVYDSAKQLFR